MARNSTILALDVGEKRIGVALADPTVRIAVAYDTLAVDGGEYTSIARIVADEHVDTIVVGYPRNQSGEPTQQTAFVEQFVTGLSQEQTTIAFQDESLTSVKAEEILNRQRRPYRKEDIDSLAASLILQDYLEARYG
jgi:putative Holliday junction resolvase